jgi:hypothetical protein
MRIDAAADCIALVEAARLAVDCIAAVSAACLRLEAEGLPAEFGPRVLPVQDRAHRRIESVEHRWRGWTQ